MISYGSEELRPGVFQILPNFLHDFTIFQGVAAFVENDRVKWVPFSGKYDTGSDDNFVTKDIIQRAEKEHLLEQIDADGGAVEHRYLGLNNQEVLCTSFIKLTWHERKGGRSRYTRFNLVDDAPFDIILGNPFILENSVFEPQASALPLRRKHRRPCKSS